MTSKIIRTIARQLRAPYSYRKTDDGTIKSIYLLHFLGHPFRASVRLRRVRAGRRQGQRQQQRRQQRVADGGGRGAGHGAAGAAELPRRLLCARRAAAAPRARRRARRHLARAGNSRLDGKPLGRGPEVSG